MHRIKAFWARGIIAKIIVLWVVWIDYVLLCGAAGVCSCPTKTTGRGNHQHGSCAVDNCRTGHRGNTAHSCARADRSANIHPNRRPNRNVGADRFAERNAGANAHADGCLNQYARADEYPKADRTAQAHGNTQTKAATNGSATAV